MGWGGERRCADYIFIQIYFRMQYAPFRSKVFKIFFASGGKGALTKNPKILRTLLIKTLKLHTSLVR